VRIFYDRSDSKGVLLLGPQWAILPTQALLHRLQEEFGKTRVVLNYKSENGWSAAR
jgi:hypothetical protein